MDLMHSAPELRGPLSGLHFLGQAPCIPTPTDSEAVAWEGEKGEQDAQEKNSLNKKKQDAVELQL